jgi:nucleotidyltransferase/DNA polymerase involved in DNA repair
MSVDGSGDGEALNLDHPHSPAPAPVYRGTIAPAASPSTAAPTAVTAAAAAAAAALPPLTLAEETMIEVRRKITVATCGLTASAGIAPTRMLAKVCSDLNKPNGQFCLPQDREAVLDFTRALSTRKVPGIGKVSRFGEKGDFNKNSKLYF